MKKEKKMVQSKYFPPIIVFNRNTKVVAEWRDFNPSKNCGRGALQQNHSVKENLATSCPGRDNNSGIGQHSIPPPPSPLESIFFV
jgi:hypothetical protein